MKQIKCFLFMLYSIHIAKYKLPKIKINKQWLFQSAKNFITNCMFVVVNIISTLIIVTLICTITYMPSLGLLYLMESTITIDEAIIFILLWYLLIYILSCSIIILKRHFVRIWSYCKDETELVKYKEGYLNYYK